MLYNMFLWHFNILQGNIPYPTQHIIMIFKRATTLFISILCNSGIFGCVKTFK